MTDTNQPDNCLLSIRGLQHAYGNRQPVLNIASLTMAQGDIVLLQGDNGSGKSTLLRILAGITKPTACGFFSFADNTAALPPAVVYLHQTPYIFSTTVRANVQYGLRCCRLPLVYGEEAMQWAGVMHLADTPALQLSGGEQRRVALARIRALRPRLYLLDEPLAHLDAGGRQRVSALISLLQQEGASAVISSHNTDLPAKQLWQLNNGDITATPLGRR